MILRVLKNSEIVAYQNTYDGRYGCFFACLRQAIYIPVALFIWVHLNEPNDFLTLGYPYFTAAPTSVPCLKAGAFDNTKQRNNNF